MSKNDEFCIKYEEFCIKNEELCIINEELCILNDEFCSTTDGHHLYQVKSIIFNTNFINLYTNSSFFSINSIVFGLLCTESGSIMY